MSEAVLVAIITGGIGLLGTIITVVATNSKTRQEMRVNIAVMDEKISELTREVRMHNDFASRVPVIEAKVESLERKEAS